MPFSLVRYSLVLRARCAARSFEAFVSVSPLFPTKTSTASGWLWALSATSSRQALASLLTRAGLLGSRSKAIEQRACTLGVGGNGGASTITDVSADAC